MEMVPSYRPVLHDLYIWAVTYLILASYKCVYVSVACRASAVISFAI